jgi:hypothetical protein
MATPHITGLAALYLGENPLATPAEIKSAMMTSATDTKTASGAAVTSPFTQGAGEVDPSDYLNPGLVYLVNSGDYESYVQGTGDWSFHGVDPIDPSDLNQASIAIGALTGSQTVTRTVTAKTAGTYTASVSGLAGITTTVTPDHFTIAAGGTQTFTVKFDRKTAAEKKFATGTLTWTNGSISVRSPIAVEPTTAPPPTAHGTGTNGTTTIDTALGSSKSTALHLYGLAAETPWPNAADLFGDDPDTGQPIDSATHFSTGSTIDPDGTSELDASDWFQYHVTGTDYIRFAETPTGTVDPSTDLDLYVLRSSSPLSLSSEKAFDKSFAKFKEIDNGAGSTPAAAEHVDVSKPSGYYLVIVDPYTIPDGGADFVQSNYTVKSGQSGHFNSSVSSIKGSTGVQSFRLGWGGLTPNTSYLGVVRYGSGSAKTLLTVDSGATNGPINVTAPAITGTGAVGSKLTASKGTWNVSTTDLALSYQWLNNGAPISGATLSTYVPDGDLAGKSLSVQVTATLGGTTTVTTNAVTVKAASTTHFTVADKTISTKVQAQLTVTVVLDPAGPINGALTIKDGSKVLTPSAPIVFTGNTASVTLPLLKKGSHKITVSYSADGTVTSSAPSQTIKVS